MKAGIVIYPGTTCDRDTGLVLKEVLGWEVSFIHYKQQNVSEIDILILPGGFSYGDYLRPGALAGLAEVKELIYGHDAKALPVLGICNGFQILLEMKLLKGALHQNKTGRFICKDTYLKICNNSSILTQGLSKKDIIELPIAHMSGNYYAETDTVEELESENLIILKYSDKNGNVNEAANPNGSTNNIAGIMNERGNIAGIMPHPERAALPFHKTLDGIMFFKSIEKWVSRYC